MQFQEKVLGIGDLNANDTIVIQEKSSNMAWAKWIIILTSSIMGGATEFAAGNHATLGPVLLTFLRHVARISTNGIAAFKESCSPIG